MNDFVRYLFESGICLTFFYTGYWIFLKRETFFKLNRFYLLASVLASFIIPSLNIPSPFLKRQIAAPVSGFSSTASIQSQSLTLGDVLLIVYFVGAGLFLLRFFYQLLRISLVVKRFGFRKHKGLNVVLLDNTFTPFSFFNFVFINDSKISEHNLNRIIAHEKVHIQQGHSVDILLLELVTILQWFNPFVWPYKKSLKETHEYLADNGVIAQGYSTARYQLLIFEQHVGAKLFELTNNFKHSQIKRRITMMSKMKSKSLAKLKVFLILPVAGLLVLAFAESRPVTADVLGATDAVVEKAPFDNDVSLDQKKDEDLKKKEKELQMKMAKIKDEAMKLKEKEKVVQEKLKETKDPERITELKSLLVEIKKKNEAMKKEYGKLQAAVENNHSNNDKDITKAKKIDLTLKKIEEELVILKEKEGTCKKELAKTDDKEKKAELKMLLEKIQQKRSDLKKQYEKFADAQMKEKKKVKTEKK
jgi:hypothetical protein